MVQTRSAVRKIVSGQVNAGNSVQQENPIVKLDPRNDVRPPAKRLRQEDAAALKKQRRGKPSELCQLNLDVLFLIAAYIHPIDLLNLARTCKSLRKLLMDRSSAFVWKTAHQQVKGLPACPADLTEPEYANLVFYARCHGCGKYTTTILWNVRRRYCPGCRIRHLRRLSSCSEVIRKNNVLAIEYITVKKDSSIRVAKDQAASFTHDYLRSSDKKQFISDKRKQLSVILQHAKRCEAWQKKRELERKRDQKECQWKRIERIFERLRQHGYSREIGYFGYYSIQQSRDSDFGSSKPLTDKEWEKIWPEWEKIMNSFRSRRLNTSVYEPRRCSLVSAYNRYVKQRPPPFAPTFDLLPHVTDLARFLPFKDLINAPEETRVNDESFANAFTQLPVLVSEWKEELNAELAELVKIPRRLCSRSSSSRQAPAPTTRGESSDANLSRLHLACALFQTTYAGVFAYPEIFLASRLNCEYENDYKDDSECSWPISSRFDLRFLEEAPYIVHACGLDPNVATVDDMDHRNARLKCLCCEERTLLMNWRHAMWHASSCHQTSGMLAPLSKSPRWQLVCDEHTNAIQAAEHSIQGNSFPSSMLCLLCRPRVGDMIRDKHRLAYHLYETHDVRVNDEDDIIQGMHYASIGICETRSVAVEMVEEGDYITFKVAK